MPITIAVDAMGGDNAPGEIVAGAIEAADELGVRVLLVGLEPAIGPLLPDATSGVELVAATEVVAMHDPPASVRTKKDASIVIAAELVRDGKADAMASAGNTGAAMAAALLRMGRIKGAARPAIAVPIPVPGRAPQILVDGGATVDCTAEWVRQFAVMGREYRASTRGSTSRASACSRTARRPARATTCARPSSRCSKGSRASSATSRVATSCTTPST